MSNLNPDQREAVETIDTGAVVLASPGSGKTSVVAAKVCHILKLKPESFICCTTFSKEGAEEMRNRILKNLPDHLHSRIVVSTLHSLCYQQLKIRYGKPTLIRGFELPHIIKKVIAIQGLIIEPDDLQSIIDKIPTEHNLDDVHQKYKDAYNCYRDILYDENKTDFNSLLVDAVNLLETNELIPVEYTHLICDESQDADMLMKRWLDVHVNVGAIPTVMLDDDQTLYSFRNSLGVKIARAAQRDYGAKIIRLGINYRSHEEILSPSRKLIKCNTDREDKDLVSHKGNGGSYSFHTVLNQHQMASKLHELLRDDPEDWYILCRTNSDLLTISSHLLSYDIPHHLTAGKSLFEQKCVEKLLNILGFCEKPTNLSSEILLRNLGVNKDGLTSLKKEYDSYLEVLVADKELPNGLVTLDNRNKITEFRIKLQAWLGQIKASRIKAVVKQITRFAEKLESSEADSSTVAMAGNLIANSFTGSLGQRLDALTSKKKNQQNLGATLMTAHASKGLEKKNVLIWNCCNDSFPAKPDMGITAEQEVAHFEEERRILYVAMTRAETNLHLVYQRRKEGKRKTTYYEPSRYLKDLGYSSDEIIESIEYDQGEEVVSSLGSNIGFETSDS